MAESFGMMDGAYFVSKKILFDWINDMLKVKDQSIAKLLVKSE